MKMQKIITYTSILAMVVVSLMSCNKDAVKPTVSSTIVSNELATPSKSSYVLTVDNAAATAETFQWTKPDFGFAAAITYKLQMDKATGDFSKAMELATANNTLSVAVIVKDFNDKVLALGLTPQTASDIKLRVVSTINDKVAPLYSNERTISVTPYATSFPPIYGMGAGLKGWGPWPDNAVEVVGVGYKKYETVAYFSNDTFRFFDQLDWNPTSFNYPYFTSVDSKLINANDGDKNFKFVGTPGWFKINIDLIAKTVTMATAEEPVMYMTGAGIGGWDKPGTGVSIKMTYVKPGVFTATANFVNDTFRFFAQADWSPTSYNYPYFTTVDPAFENANDGDKNLKYIGTPGAKKIIVDLNAKTVSGIPVLYMMGDALKGWGPWGTNEISMTYISPGVFEATTNFTNGKAFRFFAQPDWSPTSYNYPYFTTVDSNFANANDGDKNFQFVGTTGSHKVNVNLTTKVVTFTP
jgi:hypothetical protein